MDGNISLNAHNVTLNFSQCVSPPVTEGRMLPLLFGHTTWVQSGESLRGVWDTHCRGFLCISGAEMADYNLLLINFPPSPDHQRHQRQQRWIWPSFIYEYCSCRLVCSLTKPVCLGGSQSEDAAWTFDQQCTIHRFSQIIPVYNQKADPHFLKQHQL